MSAQVIRFADHYRGPARKPVTAHAGLLPAPRRGSGGIAVIAVVLAIASWCLAFFPLLWMAS